MNNSIVHELRKAGHKLRISHFRYALPKGNYIGNPSLVRVTKQAKRAREFETIFAKGGRTEVEFTPAGGGTTEFREARCNPKDPFNRKLGVAICLSLLRRDGVFA